MANIGIQLHTYDVFPGVTLTVLPTDRFKVGMLSLSFALPFSKQDGTARSLLLSVLRRGCQKYPSIADINRRLDELYATPYRVIDNTRAGVQYMGFGAELLDDRYLPEDMDLCGEVISLMRDMLFYPLREGENGTGNLCERYIEQEKKNAIDLLRSLHNEPSSYAYARFLDEFRCDDTRRLPLLHGAEERLLRLTPENLTRVWRDVLKSAPLQCFYIGGIAPDRLVMHLRQELQPAFDRVGRDTTFVQASCIAAPCWGELRQIEEQSESGQSHLILGWRSISLLI